MYEKPTGTDLILYFKFWKLNPKLVCNAEPSVDVVSRYIFQGRGSESVIINKSLMHEAEGRSSVIMSHLPNSSEEEKMASAQWSRNMSC